MPSSVLLLETWEARRAVLFVLELGFRSSSFGGDSAISIMALRQNNLLQSSFGHIIIDTLSYASLLQNFSFSHTFRQSNALAHAWAKRANFFFSYFGLDGVCSS